MPADKGEKTDSFSSFIINFKKLFALFTDGHTDQFGDPKVKKFKCKQLNHLSLQHCNDSMQIQNQNLNSFIENWKGKLEQVNDNCVAGIRF